VLERAFLSFAFTMDRDTEYISGNVEKNSLFYSVEVIKALSQRTSNKLNSFGRTTRMPTKKYQDELLEQLKDISEAAAYLTECFEDSEEVFLLGLRNVVEAHGGVGQLSKNTDLNRENLYRVLSEIGNPKLSSLAIILEALGLQVEFSKRKTLDAA